MPAELHQGPFGADQERREQLRQYVEATVLLKAADRRGTFEEHHTVTHRVVQQLR